MAAPGEDHTVDEAIAEALARGRAEDWRALWDAVDVLADESTFATWAGDDVVGATIDGEERAVRQMPYPRYLDAVGQVGARLHALGLVVPFDWARWDGVSRYQAAPATLAGAPVGDAVRLLTSIHRSERFSEGSIDRALESGVMQAALARVRRWYDGER
jgi:hypothetical protein